MQQQRILPRIMEHLSRRKLEREVRQWMSALAEVWWPAEVFQAMAERALLPTEVKLSDGAARLMQGFAGRVLRTVFQAYGDDELLTILAEESPEHGKVVRANPVWAREFLRSLRVMVDGAPARA